MKRGLWTASALAVVITGLLVGVGSSSATPPTKHPTAPTGPAYRHYIACGLSRNAEPAHACSIKSKIGAFFKSLRGDVEYKACVRFPGNELLCNEEPQEAERGVLYVNKITPTRTGRHEVTWFVKGKKVGTTVFRVK